MSKGDTIKLTTYKEMEPYMDRDARAIQKVHAGKNQREIEVPVHVIDCQHGYGKTRFKVQPKYGEEQTFWVERIRFDN